ncbi:MAG TPA: DUF6569 family protein [Pyrinomonadaceae bacterium]|nr:DUF6569 family protein [Pyrinomonadaceae bacterium]
MQILNELLDNIVVGPPQVFEEVKVFPLFSSDGKAPAPLLELDEALEHGLAEITEESEGGNVPRLTVVNKSDRDLIIYEGQQLIGAKQNRIVNVTVIVAANSTLPIPVSCVEQSRWSYTSDSFGSSQNFSYPSLRRTTHSDVSRSQAERGTADSNQSKVWSAISAKMRRMRVASPTAAIEDMYYSQVPEPKVLTEKFSVADNQVGYIAYIKGGFAGSDVYSSANVCRGKMEKLIRGYYLDSRDEAVTFDKMDVNEILREVKTAEHREFATVGKGRERRFETSHVQGSWKEVDGVIPHISILPKDGNN